MNKIQTIAKQDNKRLGIYLKDGEYRLASWEVNDAGEFIRKLRNYTYPVVYSGSTSKSISLSNLKSLSIKAGVISDAPDSINSFVPLNTDWHSIVKSLKTFQEGLKYRKWENPDGTYVVVDTFYDCIDRAWYYSQATGVVEVDISCDEDTNLALLSSFKKLDDNMRLLNCNPNLSEEEVYKIAASITDVIDELYSDPYVDDANVYCVAEGYEATRDEPGCCDEFEITCWNCGEELDSDAEVCRGPRCYRLNQIRIN